MQTDPREHFFSFYRSPIHVCAQNISNPKLEMWEKEKKLALLWEDKLYLETLSTGSLKVQKKFSSNRSLFDTLPDITFYIKQNENEFS